MSVSLRWRPVRDDDGQELNDTLKRILAGKLWAQDGSTSAAWCVLERNMLDFLDGVAASSDSHTASDANRLIRAIEKYGKVEVCIS